MQTDKLDLRILGSLHMKRTSTIEWNHNSQQWDVRFVNLDDSLGDIRFSHTSRANAIRWEQETINTLESEYESPFP